MTTNTTINTDALDLRPLLELRGPADRLVAQIAEAVTPLLDEARLLLKRDSESHDAIRTVLDKLDVVDLATCDGATHLVSALGIGGTASAVLETLLELDDVLTRNGVGQ
ncbi:MAG: hypothetical protein AAGF91_03470 [Actinomycetota bacterium]